MAHSCRQVSGARGGLFEIGGQRSLDNHLSCQAVKQEEEPPRASSVVSQAAAPTTLHATAAGFALADLRAPSPSRILLDSLLPRSTTSKGRRTRSGASRLAIAVALEPLLRPAVSFVGQDGVCLYLDVELVRGRGLTMGVDNDTYFLRALFSTITRDLFRTEHGSVRGEAVPAQPSLDHRPVSQMTTCSPIRSESAEPFSKSFNS